MLTPSYDCRLELDEIRLVIRSLKRTMDLDERALHRIETRAMARSRFMKEQLTRRVSDTDRVRTKFILIIKDNCCSIL